MSRHWEIAWTSLRLLKDDEVERSVRAIARLGCSSPGFAVEVVEGRYVAVRHRRFDEFLLEFGFAQDAPARAESESTIESGLVQHGRIAWNWCCTGKGHALTDLALYKLRQVQEITNDKLLIWDDDGMCHWAWGSCTVSEAGLNPMAIVDAHLRGLALPALPRRTPRAA